MMRNISKISHFNRLCKDGHIDLKGEGYLGKGDNNIITSLWS